MSEGAANSLEFACASSCSALNRRKRAVLNVDLASCVVGWSGIGLALRLGFSLSKHVPARLFLLAEKGVCVDCRILSSLSSSHAVVFVEDDAFDRVTQCEGAWKYVRQPPAEKSWDVVNIFLSRGAVGEAALNAALAGWEMLVAAGLRDGAFPKASDSARLHGGGVSEHVSIVCGGGGGGLHGQTRGFVSANTTIRIQRQCFSPSFGLRTAFPRHSSIACEPLRQLLEAPKGGLLLLQAGHEAVSLIEDLAHKAGLLPCHVSALDLVLDRNRQALVPKHLNVVWRLDQVCCADDDPESAGPLFRRAVHWLTSQSSARVVAVVPNPARVAPAVRAVFPTVGRLAGSSDEHAVAEAAAAARELLMRSVANTVGLEDAMDAICQVLLSSNGSVILCGESGTGKSLLVEACASSTPHVRGSLATLVHCYLGESERALAALFSEARQNKLLVLLDDVDSLLRGPTGRGLQLQLARELAKGECRALLTCRTADEALSALATRLVALKMPDAVSRGTLFEKLVGSTVVAGLSELVERSSLLSPAEIVRVVKIARLHQMLLEDKALEMKHFERALNAMGPFGGMN